MVNHKQLQNYPHHLAVSISIAETVTQDVVHRLSKEEGRQLMPTALIIIQRVELLIEPPATADGSDFHRVPPSRFPAS